MFANRLPRNLWHQTLETLLERGRVDVSPRRSLWEATWEGLRPKIAMALANGSAIQVGSSGLQLQIHRVGCTQQRVGAALFDLSHPELPDSQYTSHHLLIWERSLRKACLTNYVTRLLLGESRSTALPQLPLLLTRPWPGGGRSTSEEEGVLRVMLESGTPLMGWALLKYLHGFSLSGQQGERPELHKSLLWELG